MRCIACDNEIRDKDLIFDDEYCKECLATIDNNYKPRENTND